jgi:error-prone DNA polymerase
MDTVDRLVADVWATGLSPESHPARSIRAQLEEAGAAPIAPLGLIDGGRDHVHEPEGRDRHAQQLVDAW